MSDNHWLQKLTKAIRDKQSLKNKIGQRAAKNEKITLGRDDVQLLTEMLYDWREGLHK